MAEPRTDQRTQVLGLKFGTLQDINFNWCKIDDTIAQAFTPGSPLQLPSPLPPPPPTSITVGQLAVGATYYGQTEDTSVPTTPIPLTTEVEVARVDLSITRSGPLLVTGVISLTLANLTASLQAVAYQSTLRGPGTLRIVHYFATATPNVKLPLSVAFVTVIPPTVQASPFVSISFTKTTGADANVTLQAEDGRLTVTELA